MEKDKRVIIVVAAVLLANLMLAYFFGANSFVLLSPLSLGIISYLVFFEMQKIRMHYRVILNIGLMFVLDIGIKQLSGGTFDQVGQVITQLSFYGAVVIVFVVLMIKLFANLNEEIPLKEKAFSILIYLTLTFIELYLFNSLGPGWNYYHWN